MNLYIDCEWSEAKTLISMALVDEDGYEFYEVLEHNPLTVGDWQARNVLPILGKAHVSLKRFKLALGAFLSKYDSVHVVADWPEDIAHFCESLITGPGFRLNTPPLTMEVRRIESVSEVPHNALWDARGLRVACVKTVDPAPATTLEA